MSETPRPRKGSLSAKTFRKTDWPFYWVVQVSATYTQMMESALKPIGLDVPSWRILMSLHEGGTLSVSDIAEFCVIKLNTTTKIIQRMAQDELVTSQPRPSDRRVTEVTITSRGEALRDEGWKTAQLIFARGFDGLAPREIETMNAILRRVFSNLRGETTEPENGKGKSAE